MSAAINKLSLEQMAENLSGITEMPKSETNIDFIRIANDYVTSMENNNKLSELHGMTVSEIMEEAYKNYLTK